jgi:hypothetical protein
MTESNKNKIFWTIFALLIITSIFFTYMRIFVNKDYMLVKEVDCNSETESCFVHTPEDLCFESEDFDCVTKTEPEYYKIIYKKAANVPACNPNTLEEGEECPELVCEVGEVEEECYYEYDE